MKNCNLFLYHWMASGLVVLAMTLLPYISLAYEAKLQWPSQYKQALLLLKNTEHRIQSKSNRFLTIGKSYLQKREEYYRFLDTYIKDKKQKLAAVGASISVISKNDLLFLKSYGLADKL